MAVYCVRCGAVVDNTCNKSYYEYHEGDIRFIQPEDSNYRGYCSCNAKLESLDDIE